MIRVILCDDHAVVRKGIRDTLTEAVDIEVTGEAASYTEVREVLRHAPCDVMVLDPSSSDFFKSFRGNGSALGAAPAKK